MSQSYTLYLQLLQCNLQHTNFAVFSYKQFSTILVLYTNQTFEYCMMLSTYMFVKKKIGSIRINKSCYFQILGNPQHSTIAAMSEKALILKPKIIKYLFILSLPINSVLIYFYHIKISTSPLTVYHVCPFTEIDVEVSDGLCGCERFFLSLNGEMTT